MSLVVRKLMFWVVALVMLTAVSVSAQVGTPARSVTVTQGGLQFVVGSASRVATVGQTVFINAVVHNLSRVTYIDIEFNCVELGRSFVFVGGTTGRSTLPPGQSTFEQYRLLTERLPGANFSCALNATNAATGEQIHILAPLFYIEVR